MSKKIIRKLFKRGFTLVELLVVITIIGILAGLAVPAINGGLDKARQTADVSNIRNVGILLFSAANDNDGTYPVASSVNDVFLNLVRTRAITDGKVLSAQGYTVNVTGQSNDPSFRGTIAWGYATTGTTGLTTSDDDRYVLLCSRGYAGTRVSAETVTLSADALSWKLKGITVYTKGNAARFSGAGKGQTPSAGTAVEATAALFGGGDDSTITITDPTAN